ncbi:MAG: hypothetical protein ACFFB5_20710 [Promethearchaeota archaeon]
MANDLLTSIAAIGGLLLGFIALILSIYNTWHNRIRGPQFNLTEARVTKRRHENIDVIILIQNIGDRMGYLRWERIIIKLSNQEIESSDPLMFDWEAEPSTQTKNRLLFPILGVKDLAGAIFVANGVFSTHKGEMVTEVWEVPLTGKVDPLPNNWTSHIPSPFD